MKAKGVTVFEQDGANQLRYRLKLILKCTLWQWDGIKEIILHLHIVGQWNFSDIISHILNELDSRLVMIEANGARGCLGCFSVHSV